MARIGIMGGTFDPIHNVHLMLGIQAYREYHLDSVWYMPSKCPPHKSDHIVTNTKDRCEMVRMAVHPYPFMVFSDFELLREGNTYTADTLRLLHESYPEHEFFFIIGADSLFHIEKWYHPEQVLTQATFLVAGRLNFPNCQDTGNSEASCHTTCCRDFGKSMTMSADAGTMSGAAGENEIAQSQKMEEELETQIAYLSHKYQADIFRLHSEDTAVSSTGIRDMVFHGKSIRHMVPAEVASYIERFCLYQRVSE